MYLTKRNLLALAHFCGPGSQSRGFICCRQTVYLRVTPQLPFVSSLVVHRRARPCVCRSVRMSAHIHVGGGHNLRWTPRAPFAWRLPSRPGRLANKPQGPACLCDLPAFALLASGPRACTTEPVGLCFVVWFGMGSGD